MSDPGGAGASAGVGAVAAPAGAEWTPTSAVSFGWNAVRRDPMIVLAVFVAMLVGNALSLVGIVIETVSGEAWGRVVFELLNLPVSLWMGMGLIRYCVRIARGETPTFEDLFRGGPFWRYLGLSLLVMLLFLAGFVLCIAPGVFLAICWGFAFYLVVDRDAGVAEAMSRSWRMTAGRRLDLFLYMLLLLALTLLGLLACVVGVIVTASIGSVAGAWTYVKFLERVPATP